MQDVFFSVPWASLLLPRAGRM